MRLAHYSDIHVTVSPLSGSPRRLLGKRAVGSLNYYVGGRGRHFADVEARIRALLDDVDAQGVDHALCTGDVTQMSYELEFERCAELYGPRLAQPERHSLLPGNHDRYTPGACADARFEHWLGALSGGGRYPWRRRIADGVTLIALDVARPNSLLDSSGLCPPEQLERLAEELRDPTLADDFVIVALHYGLLRRDGRRDHRHHGIRNVDALLAVLDAPESRVDAVLHGHMHRPFSLRRGRYEIHCAGSATDLAHRPGYNVYELDRAARRLRVQRRRWDPAEARFVPDEGPSSAIEVVAVGSELGSEVGAP